MAASNNSIQAAPKYVEEFLAYDEQGNAVVLRRNTEHPGGEVSATDAPSQSRPAAGRIFSQGRASTGNFGFFSDFDQVRARLPTKGSNLT